MKIQDISFSDLPFSTLYREFTSDNKKLQDYYEVNPFSTQEFNKLASNKEFSGDRAALVGNLKDFNRPFDLDQPAMANLEALEDPEVFTVVTGQQMTVYGGPLFTVFKTITTILLARQLSKTTGKKVVPVFWLADEDHDFEEISKVKIPQGAGMKTVRLSSAKNGHSVGRIDVGDSFRSFRDEVKQLLPETDFSGELWDMLDKAYPDGQLKNGFARLMSALFSKHGLFFAGSDYEPFKQTLKKPIQTAIGKADEIHAALESQSSALEQDFHRQARIQGTTLFLHDKRKGRLRLDHHNSSWSSESGDTWTSEELLALAEDQPGRFSPNVFLRPVLQDALLPNLAYVGGPAEIAYYGQMRTVYPVFGLQMPAIVPRMSATLVESSIGRIMEQLPFRLPDYGRRIEDLEKAYIESSGFAEADGIFSDWKNEVEALAGEYIGYIAEYDASLKGSAGKETANYQKAIDKLQQKLKRSVRQKEETQLNRIRKIQHHLFPCGMLQEREVSILYFMNKYGTGMWDEILSAIDTPCFDRHKMIYL
ncbi:MAG: bacillithiol biosynthesis cysteine-adding enzyme BshC [Balneolales bacterium]